MEGPSFVSVLCFIFLLQASEQRDCFSTLCHHGLTVAECTSGVWECHETEFCEIRAFPNQEEPRVVEVQCRHAAHELTACQSRAAENDKGCSPEGQVGDCTWCCHDAACVRRLLSENEAATTATSAPATTTSPPVTTTTPEPTTTPKPCADSYSGSCAVDYPGRCREPAVQAVCEKFCNLC